MKKIILLSVFLISSIQFLSKNVEAGQLPPLFVENQCGYSTLYAGNALSYGLVGGILGSIWGAGSESGLLEYVVTGSFLAALTSAIPPFFIMSEINNPNVPDLVKKGLFLMSLPGWYASHALCK